MTAFEADPDRTVAIISGEPEVSIMILAHNTTVSISRAYAHAVTVAGIDMLVRQVEVVHGVRIVVVRQRTLRISQAKPCLHKCKERRRHTAAHVPTELGLPHAPR